jgi:hypothetical protein
VASPFTENELHKVLYAEGGLETFIQDDPKIEKALEESEYKPPTISPANYSGPDFELWKLVKSRVLQKIGRLHQTIRYGDFIGSKVNLRTDSTKPMQLDLLGQHDPGLFILELKVEKSAERNAFSELFAYSNYVAEMFALSGGKDIANVLVANLDNKITARANYTERCSPKWLASVPLQGSTAIVSGTSLPDMSPSSPRNRTGIRRRRTLAYQPTHAAPTSAIPDL